MPDSNGKMTQQEFLTAIAKATRKNQPGKDEQDLPGAYNPVLPSPNMDITPAKPDPEASANSQLTQATRPGAMNIPSGGAAGYTPPPASNGVNPDTGMPYFSPQQNQMSDDDKAKLQMKMQYLQGLQNTGGNSGQ